MIPANIAIIFTALACTVTGLAVGLWDRLAYRRALARQMLDARQKAVASSINQFRMGVAVGRIMAARELSIRRQLTVNLEPKGDA